jgi:hypothetical protein
MWHCELCNLDHKYNCPEDIKLSRETPETHRLKVLEMTKRKPRKRVAKTK